MPNASANPEQAAYWESRAASWIDAEDFTSLVAGPFGRLAIDALAQRPGWRVLDVGCGSGPTTLELARRVAPSGSVLGVDISPSMVEAAARRAQEEGVAGVGFAVADAQAHDLGDDAFDAVFSRFGVMFFADPAAAFTNLHRSLRQGGRLAFVCWQDLFANEWMLVPGAAALGVTGTPPPMPEPGQPGPFSLSDPAAVADLLRAAGFAGVDVAPVSDALDLPGEQLDQAAAAACKVGAAREAIEGSDDAEVATAIRRAVRDALAERVVDGRLRLASAALVVTATA